MECFPQFFPTLTLLQMSSSLAVTFGVLNFLFKLPSKPPQEQLLNEKRPLIPAQPFRMSAPLNSWIDAVCIWKLTQNTPQSLAVLDLRRGKNWKRIKEIIPLLIWHLSTSLMLPLIVSLTLRGALTVGKWCARCYTQDKVRFLCPTAIKIT